MSWSKSAVSGLDPLKDLLGDVLSRLDALEAKVGLSAASQTPKSPVASSRSIVHGEPALPALALVMLACVLQRVMLACVLQRVCCSVCWRENEAERHALQTALNESYCAAL
jgi:hypothetical protein